MKKYIVRLTGEEHQQLEDLVSKGQTQAYKIRTCPYPVESKRRGSLLDGCSHRQSFLLP